MKLFQDKKIAMWLSVIILLAAFLRFYNLSLPDMTADNAINSFRSIGYFDYLAAENTQSTPVDWYEEKQWWQKLSFHDHPPVTFFVQHIFFKTFGVSVFTARLPFVLASLFSILFLYLFVSLLYGRNIGFFSSAIFAVMNLNVWSARQAYLEPFVVMFALGALYFFVKAQKNAKQYVWWGIFLGFGIATKYTFLFMVPVFLVYLFFYQKKSFRHPFLYGGCATTLVILSPIIVYNTMMYLGRGHFDAALSSMLGMMPADFSILDRTVGGGSLLGVFSPFVRNENFLFILLFLASLFYLVVRVQKQKSLKKYMIILLYGVFSVTILYFSGTSERFVPILSPFFAIVIGLGVGFVYQFFQKEKIKQLAFVFFFCALIFFSALYTFNSQNVLYSKGSEGVLYSPIKPRYDGYLALDNYLETIREETYPEQVFSFYTVPQVIQKQIEIFQRLPSDEKQKSERTIIAYDNRINWFTAMWIFEKRKLYEMQANGPIVTFLETVQDEGLPFFKNLGFSKAYFIIATDESVIDYEDETKATQIDFFRDLLYAKNILPIKKIENPYGETVFEVFEIDFENQIWEGVTQEPEESEKKEA